MCSLSLVYFICAHVTNSARHPRFDTMMRARTNLQLHSLKILILFLVYVAVFYEYTTFQAVFTFLHYLALNYVMVRPESMTEIEEVKYILRLKLLIVSCVDKDIALIHTTLR
jgi:K+-sensing histidine kinase KdpD